MDEVDVASVLVPYRLSASGRNKISIYLSIIMYGIRLKKSQKIATTHKIPVAACNR